MGRQQHGDLLLAGDAGQQADDLLNTADVQVGQRLVQQEQPGAADQGVRDQHPLLLATGQIPHPGIGEALGIDRVQHLADRLAARPRAQRYTEAVPIQPERDQVPGPHRHVRVQEDLLRDIADGRVPPGAWPSQDGHAPGGRPLQAEDHPQQRRLACPVRADQAGELAGADGEAYVVEDLPAAQGHADPGDVEDLFCDGAGRRPVGHHSFCVEILSATALRRALTSATIHDW